MLKKKAGIIKEGIPVVIGERQKECDSVFNSIATKLAAPIEFVSDTKFQIPEDFPFIAEYLKKNYKTALCAVKHLSNTFPQLMEDKLYAGLKSIKTNTGFQARDANNSRKSRELLLMSPIMPMVFHQLFPPFKRKFMKIH